MYREINNNVIINHKPQTKNIYIERGGSGPWKSTFTKDSTTFFKQITGGYFLYQHVEN